MFVSLKIDPAEFLRLPPQMHISYVSFLYYIIYISYISHHQAHLLNIYYMAGPLLENQIRIKIYS